MTAPTDRGVPMPPETREAMAVLIVAMTHPRQLDRATARRRIEELADQLDARLQARSTV